jgi:prepilin-type N-terminal cleavage/methylation domain-containing protein
MVRRSRAASGMTLIEVLVALLLATIALLGSLALVLTSSRGGAFARQLTEASVLAQSKLEALVGRTDITLSNPPSTQIDTETSLTALGVQDATSGLGIYTRTTTWGISGSLKHIVVTVGWTDNSGNTHTVFAQRDRAP